MKIFCGIEQALEDVRNGRLLIICDDEDRENEGDLFIPAAHVTPEAINFMATHARGLICMPITNERARILKLDLLQSGNNQGRKTAFTTPIDLIEGNTTGISAQDRARTIRTAIAPDARPEQFLRPGHIFPLIACDRGVLERNGHTEASVDLARLAGLEPAGVICEILRPDGTMARRDDLVKLACEWNINLVTIKDLIDFRLKIEGPSDQITPSINSVRLPTRHGDFRLFMEEGPDHLAPIVMIKGEIEAGDVPLVRVHSECFTGDLLGSLRCDCGEQLDHSLELIAREGKGILIYLRQEGRGIGLRNKICAYALQDEGLDTVAANLALGFTPDLREYTQAAEILSRLGIKKIRLLTNNPAKVEGLESNGIEVQERIGLEVCANHENFDYLFTKKTKMGHLFNETLSENPEQISLFQ
jgi:3,4-dihydroxy 2-butanone 4-phosphate synthase/GTP cyclohydrolase II